MSCVHFTPAQGRSRDRASLFLIRESPPLPGFPSDVYGIMTQRSDYARPRPCGELDQALHTLEGYVLLTSCEWPARSHDKKHVSSVYTATSLLPSPILVNVDLVFHVCVKGNTLRLLLSCSASLQLVYTVFAQGDIFSVGHGYFRVCVYVHGVCVCTCVCTCVYVCARVHADMY